MRTPGIIAWCLIIPAGAVAGADRQAAGRRPTVWMGPPSYGHGKCFRELFEKPDGWTKTRAAVDVLMYADHCLHKQFTDPQLRAWFALLKQWKLKLCLEVGAVKPWGLTAQKTFAIQQPRWERFKRLGADIYAIAMDEPLLCARKHIHKSDDYALQETAAFIALVRKHFPEAMLGDIETYPSIPLADHTRWIEALEKRLAAMHVRTLDFYRLDVNWAEFVVFDRGNWGEVKKLERLCRRRKLPFSLIYWASDYPTLARKGLADDSSWYVSVMRQGYDYAMVDGSPDHYVVQSWLPAPSRSTPETAPYSFTRSVLDFTRRFVRRPGAGRPAARATTRPATRGGAADALLQEQLKNNVSTEPVDLSGP